jgi:NAD(P)-dependent dehydrogenase (short-subunit alcohol dehydrogenase family)
MDESPSKNGGRGDGVAVTGNGGRLAGKVALVTGGTTGIGEAIVRRFVAEGARVVFCARTESAGRALEESLDDGARFVQCDVTDEHAVDALVAATVAEFGGLDVVVSNAGTGGGQPWPNEPTDVWNGFVDLNLNGMMYVCRAAWPHLVASGDASIVAITSLSAWMGVGQHQLEKMGGQPSASYQASKAAMEGLTVHLAGRGGEHGIRVNAVRPGRILTDKFRQWLGEDGIFWSHYREAQIIKRHGHVDDVANAVLFYASDESSFITGTVLDVNGGAVVKV